MTTTGSDPAFLAPLSVAVREVASKRVLWADADESLADAATRMDDAGAGSILVRYGEDDDRGDAGILTDRDLRRAVACRLGSDVPVGEIASRPLERIDADAPLVAAHLRMLERRVRHLAVEEAGSTGGDDAEIVGLLSSTDLHRHQSQGPFFVLHRLETDEGVGFTDYARQRTGAVLSMHRVGVDALRLARVASHLDDELTRRVLAKTLAEREAEGDAPPAPWAWITFGADGRREQPVAVDQHNALIFDGDAAPEAGPEAVESFHRFAESATEALRRAGLPSARAGFDASRWCAPLAEWQRRLEHWIENPDEESIEHAVVFFDLRRVGGDLDLGPLQDILRRGAGESAFLRTLAATAAARRPPLRGIAGAPYPLRRLKSDENGEIDVFEGGVRPLVALARVLGLAAGSPETGTVERLDAARDAGLLDADAHARLGGIFGSFSERVLHLRLRAVEKGRHPEARVRLAGLDRHRRKRLREAFAVIRREQKLLPRRVG